MAHFTQISYSKSVNDLALTWSFYGGQVKRQLRYHYTAQYLAAVLTEEPGMRPKASIMQDTKAKGVGFLRIDINHSGMTFKAERNRDGSMSIRVPLTSIEAVTEASARKIMQGRLAHGPYRDARDLYERVKLDKDMLQKLARAGAFDSVQERRDALYQIDALVNIQPPAVKPLLSALPETPPLSNLSPKEQVVWDYDLKCFNEWGVHVINLMRQELLQLGAKPMERLPQQGYVTTSGKVVSKQRPPTAKEYAFYVIEDGPLRCQVVISPSLQEQHRDMLIGVHLMLVTGWLAERGKA